MIRKIIYICLFVLIEANSMNLIKKGDFQSYAALPFNFYSNIYNGWTFYAKYISISSNLSDWFDLSMGVVQFIQQWTSHTPTTTIVVDLSSQIPMTLCQYVNLVTGSLYKLTFDMKAPYRIQKMYVKAYLNQFLLTTLFIPTNQTTKTQVYIFQADRDQNIICFNETHSPAPPFSYSPYVGGQIDNISLLLVSYKLQFSFFLSELEQSLYLIGNQKYNQSLIYDIEKRYDLYIEENQISYNLNYTDNGTIFIEIKENYSFNLNNVKFKKKIGYNYSLNGVYVQISLSPPPPTKKYFFNLKQNQIQTLKKSKQVLLFINQIYSKISVLCQTFLFAYFVNMIIDIQVLSLFYIFAQIKVIPDFTSKIYFEILRIVFSTQNLVQYSLNLLEVPLKNFNIQFQEIFPERINKLKNEQPWFGTFGISSKVINSNLSSILVLILTFVKLVLMKLIIRLITVFIPSVKVKIHILSQILTQFCFLLPIFIISMQANVIDSLINFNEKVYKTVCFLFIFISLMLFFLYIFFHSFQGRKRISKKQKQIEVKITQSSNKQNIILKEQVKDEIQKKSKKILIKFTQQKTSNIESIKKLKVQKSKNKLKMVFNDEAFSMLLFFFIPFMSLVGNSKLFLMTNTLTVLFRFFSFLKKNNQKDQLFIRRIVDFLIGSVWIIHHSIFVVFFFYQNTDLNQNQIYIVIYLGIAAIFTVTFIVILQIFKYLIVFLRESFKICKQNLMDKRTNKKQNKKQNKTYAQNNLRKGNKKMAFIHTAVSKSKK